MSDNKPTPEEQWQSIENFIFPACTVGIKMLSELACSLFEGDNFIEIAKQKFLAGAAEFDGQWLTMDHMQLGTEALDEALDLVIYAAMGFALAEREDIELFSGALAERQDDEQ